MRTPLQSPPSMRVVAPVLGLALDGVGIGPDGGAWEASYFMSNAAQCDASAICANCHCQVATAPHRSRGEWLPLCCTCWVAMTRS